MPSHEERVFFTRHVVLNIAAFMLFMSIAIAGGVMFTSEGVGVGVTTTGEILLGCGVSFMMIHLIVGVAYIIWRFCYHEDNLRV